MVYKNSFAAYFNHLTVTGSQRFSIWNGSYLDPRDVVTSNFVPSLSSHTRISRKLCKRFLKDAVIVTTNCIIPITVSSNTSFIGFLDSPDSSLFVPSKLGILFPHGDTACNPEYYNVCEDARRRIPSPMQRSPSLPVQNNSTLRTSYLSSLQNTFQDAFCPRGCNPLSFLLQSLATAWLCRLFDNVGNQPTLSHPTSSSRMKRTSTVYGWHMQLLLYCVNQQS